MSDWPKSSGGWFVPHSAITTGGYCSSVGLASAFPNFGGAAGAWPAANRALFWSFTVAITVTVYQVAIVVGTQSGNLDVGIYDELSNRVVSKGSTAVGASGLQTIDITDTTLAPGGYFAAMCVDNTTATFNRAATLDTQHYRVAGVQEQAVGAVTLPNPATFANPSSAYIPAMSFTLRSTTP